MTSVVSIEEQNDERNGLEGMVGKIITSNNNNINGTDLVMMQEKGTLDEMENEEEQQKCTMEKQEDDRLVIMAENMEREIEQEVQESVQEAENEGRLRSQVDFVLTQTSMFKKLVIENIEKQRAKAEKKKSRKRKAEQAAQQGSQRKSIRLQDGNQEDAPPRSAPLMQISESTISNHQNSTRPQRSGRKSSSQNNDRKTRKESENAHSLQPGQDSSDDVEFGINRFFTGGTLRDYQIEGVKWLNSLFTQGVNGILADEMGLGKTAQTIGLICHLYSNGYYGKPFLIVAPLSTIGNWKREFNRFSPEIPVILYHGVDSERDAMRRQFGPYYTIKDEKYKVCPVVITNYETVIRDARRLQLFDFGFFVMDEGHRIKNYKCSLHRVLKSLKLANRLLLTGTPLQNNLTELWSLLNFLMPVIFNSVDWFLSFFDFSQVTEFQPIEGTKAAKLLKAKPVTKPRRSVLAQEQQNQMVTKLHDILGAFMLRREKKDVELSLPPKKEILLYAPLSQLQAKLYKTAVEGNIYKFYGRGQHDGDEDNLIIEGKRERSEVDYKLFYSESDEHLDMYEPIIPEPMFQSSNKQKQIGSGPTTLVNQRSFRHLLMTLRKIVNHPHLIEWPIDPTTDEYIVDERCVTDSGKMMVLDRLLMALKKEGGHKVLLFSQFTQMLNVIHDYCTHYRGFKVTRLDGSVSLQDREDQMDIFNDDPDTYIMLVSTRAGGLGINLTAADTVIIYDSDWNPQCDLQAQDRCHRIGQSKPVIVYRFVARATADQALVERAQQKRCLEKMIVRTGRFMLNKSLGGGLGAEELLELLNSTDYSAALETSGISDDDLKEIMDRSEKAMSSDNKQPNSKGYKVVGQVENKLYTVDAVDM